MSDEKNPQVGNGIKIQINSLSALERLIGGDSELEIQIRNNIVRDFTKKHLKDIVNSDFILQEIQGIKSVVKQETAKLAEEELLDKTKNRWGEVVFGSLKQEVKDSIKSQISITLTQLVQDSVKAYTESDDFKNVVRSYVNTYAYRQVEEDVKNKIKQALGKSI